jgi:hypothetical protein
MKLNTSMRLWQDVTHVMDVVLGSGGLLASVARGMDPILCEDVNSDERYDPEVLDQRLHACAT